MIKIIFLILAFSLPIEAREVTFSWKPMAGAVKYEIQISQDEGFAKPIDIQKIEKPEFPTQLGLGKYFYRVRIIDSKERLGRWSKPAGVTISPYSPELIEPKVDFQTSYFEVLPKINFSWKAVEGTPKYEILISKTTGQKVLESPAESTSFSTDKVPEGEYSWRVRSVSNDNLFSDYSEPRKFLVIRKPLTPPKLIAPAKDGISAAYRPVSFSWEQDPNTHFTDLTFEKLSGREGAKLFKTKIENIKDSKYQAEYEEPGKYRWSVTTKEAETTPGLGSEIYNFEVRNDLISRGNYELEFSLSPVSDLYTTSSARQTSGVTSIAQQSNANGTFVGFLGGYYLLESLGFYVSTRMANLQVENLTGYEQETDLSLRLRFGVKGFSQEFWYGYRIMDLVEAENTPTQLTTDFTALGPLIGTRVSATVVDNWKAQLQAFYFKPLSNMEGVPGFTGDVYGGSLGVKWNFMYQFWLGYRFSMERINANFVTPNQSPSVNSSWTMYRTEPLYFSISFEH